MAVQATSLKLASVIAIDAAGVGEGPDVRRIVIRWFHGHVLWSLGL